MIKILFPILSFGAILFAARTPIELKNDVFNETTGEAYLQQGFVKEEMAGIWVQVPASVKKFKVDYFRVVFGGANSQTPVFFQMAVQNRPMIGIPKQIENAAQLTAGPYFNDIPAIGHDEKTLCANGGQYIGAALEFTHTGIPSIFRDKGPIRPELNLIYAKDGGWSSSSAFGVTGNWVMRIVGHEAEAGECK